MCDKTRKQLVVTGNPICISLPLTPHDRIILTTIFITTHIFISMLKKPRCIYITYPTVAKNSDSTAKGLGFGASGLRMWEPGARLKHINCRQLNNHDFKTLIIVTFFRLETALVGEIMGSSRSMEDSGGQAASQLQRQSLSLLCSCREHGQKQTRLLGRLCLAAVRTSHNNRVCTLSGAQVIALR